MDRVTPGSVDRATPCCMRHLPSDECILLEKARKSWTGA